MTATPAPEHRPQIYRIARLLGVDVADLTDLEPVPDADLRVLHDQISHRLFSGGKSRFVRVAALSRAMPGPMAGKLAERFLPPVLAARVSEVLEPDRARDLVGKVSLGYLCDITMALDPVAARPVVQAIPAKRIGEVAGEMFRRGEHVVMAEYVGVVTLEALHEALAVATPQDLVTLVPMLEWNDTLDQAIADLPDAQVQRIVAELDAGAIAGLVEYLDPAVFGPLVGRAVTHLPDADVARLVDGVVAGEHWHLGEVLLTAVEGQGAQALERLLGRADAVTDESLAALRAAGEAGLLSPRVAALVERAASLRS